MEKMSKEFQNLAIKFGEDPETFQWEDFFSLLLSFKESIEVF